MKLAVTNVKFCKGKAGPKSMLRFDLSFCDDEGQPGYSLLGCNFTAEGRFLLPRVRWGFVAAPREFGQLSDQWRQELADTICKNCGHMITQLVQERPEPGEPGESGGTLEL